MTVVIGAQSQIHGGLVQSLRPVPTDRIGGLLETLASPTNEGQAELAKIAGPRALEINDLLPIAAALIFSSLPNSRTVPLVDRRGPHLRSEQYGGAQAAVSRASHPLRFACRPYPASYHRAEDHQPPRERFELELQDHLNQNESASYSAGDYRLGAVR
jgi:NitT/TauT family transport system ATP-binding protein